MVRSRFGRVVYGGLGLMLLALPLLIASDRDEPFDSAYWGLTLVLAPMAVALVVYAIPRPPKPGDPPAAVVHTLTVDGRAVTGTLLPLPPRRRIARVVYRAAWLLWAVAVTVLVATEPDGAALAVGTGVLALGLTPGLVSAVRGLQDPGLTGVFLAPEGLAVRGPRRFLSWTELDRPEVFTFDYRGVTSRALALRRHSGRAFRGPEPSLPLCAEDLVALIEDLRGDDPARARLADGRLPGVVPAHSSGLT